MGLFGLRSEEWFNDELNAVLLLYDKKAKQKKNVDEYERTIAQFYVRLRGHSYKIRTDNFGFIRIYNKLLEKLKEIYPEEYDRLVRLFSSRPPGRVV